MIAEVVTVGNEILSGRTVDTNLAFLARELEACGARIAHHQTVADRVEEIVAVLRLALGRADLIVVTGGLGPTPDDLTRKGIAQAFGRPLALDERVLETVRARWRALGGGGPMPASNELQALLPRGATALDNPVGSAPGLFLEERGRGVFVLPGVPAEMEAICRGALLPWVAERAGEPIEYLDLRTTGIRESVLAERLAGLEAAVPGCAVAYLPSLGGVDVRVRLPSGSRAAVAAAREAIRAHVRERLGEHLYAEGNASLAEAVGRLLLSRGWRIAVAESCTGGLLAARFTDVPGSSRYFERGVVCYSDRAKEELVGVPVALLAAHGAVSEQVARALARGAAERFGVECGLGVTGIAGPDGGTPEKPVGTVHLAAVTPDGERTRRLALPGDRDAVRRRSVTAALDLLRRLVLAAGG